MASQFHELFGAKYYIYRQSHYCSGDEKMMHNTHVYKQSVWLGLEYERLRNVCSLYEDGVCHTLAACREYNNGTKAICVCPDGTIGDGKRIVPESGVTHTGCFNPTCPNGQIKYAGQCFSFPPDKPPADKAKKKCEANGGHLLTLSSDSQWKFVKTQMIRDTRTSPLLIGYTDADIEGQFVWADNTAFYEKWAPNEPSLADSAAKDCVVIDPSKGYAFVTVKCDGNFAYACSQGLDPNSPCPPGWSYNIETDDCYFDKPDKENFLDSHMTCVEHGADLLKIATKADTEKYKATFTMPAATKMWIGLSRVGGSWKWMDGTTATYYDWGANEPMAGKDCVVIDDSMKWFAADCKTQKAMVKCEKGKKEDKTCPEGSQRFGEFCYKSEKDPVGGGEASKTCEKFGSGLVLIKNEMEQKFIADFLMSKFPDKDFWIGLREDKLVDGEYEWDDKTALVGWKGWGNVQPNDKKAGNCVALDHKLGFDWNDESCAKKNYPLCMYRNHGCVVVGECAVNNSDCTLGQCRCKDGYVGDGKNTCVDVDECEEGKDNCHEKANCTNTPGTFECNCKTGYEGDGLKCKDIRICTDDSKCSSKGKCNRTADPMLCECNPGYEGNGITCTNTDECKAPTYPCNVNANCEDTEGDFKCECKNGFAGDGQICKKIPINCEEIRVAGGKPEPKEKPGDPDRYLIDPDGAGDLSVIKVKCIMRDDIGITVVDHPHETPTSVPPNNKDPHSYTKGFKYEFDVLMIVAIVKNSDYCYQNFWHKCQAGHDFLANNNTYWTDRDRVTHNSWSGSVVDGKCKCGEVAGCRDSSAMCNCDGKQTSPAEDGGFLTVKKYLPVTSFTTGGITNGKSAYWKVGPVKCGPKPFDIPKDCHEAKTKFNMKTNSILLIDVDGPDGETEPFYVNCEMTKYPQTGVTKVPHNNGQGEAGKPSPVEGKTGPGEPQEPKGPGDIPLRYPVTDKQIKKLIELSEFCSQYVEFECTNHPITADTKWYDIDNKEQSYFPGGNAGHVCGCGVTGTCENNKQCNCDIADGKTRKDLGLLTKKDSLPVKKLKFGKIGTGGAKGKFKVGQLMCGQAQFGIPPTCQEIRKETPYTYTYYIDPDAGDKAMKKDGTQAPFRVHCRMIGEPPIGITVVPHNKPTVGPEHGPLIVKPKYHDATLDQIKGLTKVVSYCKQSIKVDCKKFKLHEGGKQLVYWKDVNGISRYYLSGKSGNSCEKNPCNCDDRSSSWSNDNGYLIEKSHLPVSQMVVDDLKNAGAEMKYELGPLECYNLFPTCHHLYQAFKYVEFKLSNGNFIIDSDGPTGEDPFKVWCKFPHITQVYPKSGHKEPVNDKDAAAVGDKTKCIDVKYQHASYTQLKGLTTVSGFCKQYGVYWGWNAPFTGHMHWEYNDGTKFTKQPGWGASLGVDKCACGTIEACKHGRAFACDTDKETGKWEVDHGDLINKDVLPIGRFCHNYKDVNRRWSQHNVYVLECAHRQFDIPESCQELRDWKYWNYEYLQNDIPGFPGDTVYLIDPDKTSSSIKPFPALCKFTHSPPIGVTVINHLGIDCAAMGSTKSGRSYLYLRATKTQIAGLTKISQYCTQSLNYECSNDKLVLEKDKYGWFDINGKWASYWAGDEHGKVCTGADCKCQGTGDHVDGSLLSDKNVLPVSTIKVPATTGSRKLCVGPLYCSSLYRNCHEILLGNDNWNPLRKNFYAIDPDGWKIRKPFLVVCDFKTDKKHGITIVNHKAGSTFKPTADGMIDITYPAAPHYTIQGLAEVSQYCAQELRYKCTKAPLLGDKGSYYSDFGGKHMPVWPAVKGSTHKGCACSLFNTCPKDYICRCDGTNTSPIIEGDLVVDRNMVPVKSVHVKGLGVGSKVEFVLGPLKCSPRPHSLPVDCQDVLNKGYNTGEYYIWPKRTVDPFLVHCNMDLKNKIAVTNFVVKNSKKAIPTTGKVPVEYIEATIAQVKALIEVSEYCVQPAKYNCMNTNMFGSSNKGSFSFKNGKGQDRTYFAYGGNKECGCGVDDRCGGPGTPKEVNDRACSCDSGDTVARVDAGAFSKIADFPITEFNFGAGIYTTSLLTVGNLQCARGKFDIDECSTGFHDCDVNAECSNRDPNFVCICKPGWQGKGTDLPATGRQCPNDDECKIENSPCPQDRAICQDLPGDFNCTCKKGYRQINKTTCIDIDECTEKTHDCDDNARCVNTIGSFKCYCNPGYRGMGKKGQCEEIGRCSCFGDPHCTSFDNKWLHFQGLCSYTMARDRCEIGGEPNYRVIQKNWRKGRRETPVVTWVKEVVIIIGVGNERDYSIQLLQDNEVHVNKERVNLPYVENNLVSINNVTMTYTIDFEGSDVAVKFKTGLEVWWSGTTRVDVVVPTSFKKSTCGLCGIYNNDPKDDWTLGRSCKDTGVTANNNKFGNSWWEANDDKSCTNDCDPVADPVCSGADRVSAEALCKELKDEQGRFKECLAVFPASSKHDYYDACVYDACRARNQSELAICEAAESLVKDCLSEQKITLTTNWRSKDFCEKKCKAGMVYKQCGSPCETKTCANPTAKPGPCIKICKQGCFCKDGLVMDGDKCVKPEECGCVEDGRYYKAGERVVRPNCTADCLCNSTTRAIDCTKITCHKEAYCKIEDGTNDCYCKNGFKGDGQDCKDIDECNKTSPAVCDKNAYCNNTYGSHNCTCNEGWEGSGDPSKCKDIDECTKKTDDCDENAKCRNTDGSFECDCKAGYKADPLNPKKCKNIDECTSNRAQCDKISTTCKDTDGSYDCNCRDGFTERINRFECKNDDECANKTYTNDCHPDAGCTDLPGTFSCKCKEGYKGNGTFCEDKDECVDDKFNDCDENAYCNNTIGSYNCTCDKGFKGTGTQCEDIKECDDPKTSPNCDHRKTDGVAHGKCKEKEGSYKCKCKQGFRDVYGNGSVCDDIDECKAGDAVACGDHSNCTNTPIASYTCTCEEGYASDTKDGKNCKDIKECDDPKTSPNCDHRKTEGVDHGYCEEKGGGYDCKCSKGFEDVYGNGSVCNDIDECKKNISKCPVNSQCVNKPGTSDCKCDKGFRENAKEECDNIDECAEKLDNCDDELASCSDVDATYVCTCKEGYDGTGQKGDCKEIDKCKDNIIGCSKRQNCKRNGPADYVCECKSQYETYANGSACRWPDPCKNMTNTPCFEKTEICYYLGNGKYTCTCKDGYAPRNTSKVCEDVNECLDGTNKCDEVADCDNTDGEYNCRCKKGFTGDGQVCNNVDECKKDPPPCKGPTARCIDTHGDFVCKCGKGYRINKTSNTCEDLDECKTDKHNCRKTAECNNTAGSYVCTCKNPTYILAPDGKGCNPPDDCSADPKRCLATQVCRNRKGDKKCVCKWGYKLVGETCEDKDECQDQPPPCSGPNMYCKNKVPGFSCECDDGYEMKDGKCENVNECTDPRFKDCGEGATCKDNDGGFECTCAKGYKLLLDNSCEDINECEDQKLSGCHDSAKCDNTQGSHTCTCKEGYEGNGKVCKNLDECASNKHQCSPKAKCKDTIGSYTCDCVKGYTGDGRKCDDVDECDRGLHNCGDHAKCINVPGSFKCECDDGYSGHCDACKDINECKEGKANCNYYASCVNYPGGYTCNCPRGLYGDGVKCDDFDECALGLHRCPRNSVCQNLFGRYRCICEKGFRVGGFFRTQCVDYDECAASVAGCDEKAKCINTVGAFFCQCLPGFDGDGLTCKPNNAKVCGDKTCDDNADCIDGVCKCGNGFEGVGFIGANGKAGCDDIDECKIGKVYCDARARCINTPGSYHCRCSYPYLGSGEICYAPWNPCQNGNACGKDAWCDKVRGRPVCRCLDEFKRLGPNAYHCFDIDECQNPDQCGGNQECIDHYEGAACTCPLGKQLVDEEGKKVCEATDACEEKLDICVQPFSKCVTLVDGDGYECQCDDGYTRNKDTHLCELTEPECDKACPPNKRCRIMKSGESGCGCKEGFKWNSDTKDCEDKDECNDRPNIARMCGRRNAVCVNLTPGVKCVCQPGFIDVNGICVENPCLDKPDGTQKCWPREVCIPDDTESFGFKCECAPGNKWQDDVCVEDTVPDCNCGPHGSCKSKGSQALEKCRCAKGFRIDPDAVKDICVDENECDEPNACHMYGECENTAGSFTCKCPDGYVGDGYSYCDKDECLKPTDNRCHELASCVNTPAGYDCECKDGTKGDGFECTPVPDPCLINRGGCPLNSQCKTINNKAKCTCDYGYKGDGENCLDVNECTATGLSKHSCDSNAVCKNFAGGNICDCKTGFAGDGRVSCADVDECAIGKHTCHVHANCSNEIGGHKCKCNSGYVGDGLYCSPDVKCAQQGGCHQKATCTLRNLGYVCKCNSGYKGDGKTCDDINECANDELHTCHKNAECKNRPAGTYTCKCKPGTKGDGKTICKDYDDCVGPTGKDCGPNADCVDRFEKPARCKCKTGSRWNSTSKGCDLLNECASKELNQCDDQNAECIDTKEGYECKCKDGYRGNGKRCSDIDECAEHKDKCIKNSDCHNTPPGSFTCKCMLGFKLGKDTCDDINECDDPKLNSCAPDANCTNKDGYYECECLPGFNGTGWQCVKLSPCDQPGVCDALREDCKEKDGKAVCECAEGLAPNPKNNGTCGGVNECKNATAVCGPFEDCVDKWKGFECPCKKGFIKIKDKCEDINECDPTTPAGGGAKCDSTGGACTNSEGGSSCTCERGFTEGADNKCTSNSTCKVENGGCDDNAKCSEGQARTVCVCKDGFDGDGKNCTDINECKNKQDDCNEKQKCVNNDGGFTCECKDGFKKNATTKECDDVDECAKKEDGCHPNATCVNLQGTVGCICKPGFRGDGKNCDDIDECKEKIDPCSPNAYCNNTIGYCECTCEHGYVGDGIICEEIDECKLPVGCDGKVAFCKKVDGKDTCVCKSGYVAKGVRGTCIDEDECKLKKDKCSPNASCKDKTPGYTCECKPGYVGDGYNCVDVDECEEDKDNCHENGKCKNENGTFTCGCKKGYKGDGVTKCDNVKECEKPTNDCAPEADCKDTPGSYVCKCKKGYRGDGKKCEQIDECKEGSNDCDYYNAACKDLPGTFECECKEGFVGDGKVCKDTDECKNPVCPRNTTCINLKGKYYCQCELGFVKEGNVCNEVNECDNPDACDSTAKCINTRGSFRCLCKKGFKMSPSRKCEDINECSIGQPCYGNGKCHNTPGSFKCICDEGFKPDEDGIYCVDDNECDRNPCPEGECQNTNKGYRCKCPKGFTETGVSGGNLQRSECIDVDECKLTNHSDCGDNGTCKNTKGSFRCECDKGYEPIWSGRGCRNVDECKLPKWDTRAAKCNGKCTDTDGSYDCDCLKGYKKVGEDCVDINECDDKPCDGNATCFNTDGSFKCRCKDGLQGDGLYCEDINECQVLDWCKNPSSTNCINNFGGNTICSCKPGYEDKNGFCVDKDECKAITCGNNAYCTNKIGSFQCFCKSGYVGWGRHCKNFDECRNGNNNCDVNALCTDKDPWFKCNCRYGFDGDGRLCTPKCRPGLCREPQTCVLKNSQPTCVCLCEEIECFLNNGFVCGTDQQTYSSYKEMKIESCKAGSKKVDVDHPGHCARTCDDIECPDLRECFYDDKGRPGCRCIPCTVVEKASGPVCSDDGKTYKNQCEFKTRRCLAESGEKIAYEGKCTDVPGACQVSEWTPWSNCSVTCGVGETVKTRTIKTTGEGSCPRLKAVQDCNEPACVGDACSTVKCPRMEQVCVVNDGKAECRCPICSSEDYAPICVRFGRVTTTKNSMCAVRRDSCYFNQGFSVIKEGLCKGEQPENPSTCLPVRQYIRLYLIYNGIKYRTRHVRYNYCDGGCGKYLGVCCRPERAVYKYGNVVVLYQGRWRLLSFRYAYVVKCKCKDERPTPATFPTTTATTLTP